MFLGTTHNTSGWSTSVSPIKGCVRSHVPEGCKGECHNSTASNNQLQRRSACCRVPPSVSVLAIQKVFACNTF